MRAFLQSPKSLFLLLMCSLFSSWAYGQTRDWSTIREADTPYFAGGVYQNRGGGYTPTHLSTSGRLLRRIQVDSIRQLTGERRLYFPKVLRSIDTVLLNWPISPSARLQAGWQGSFCRQLADGTDEFYNFRNDTIRIRTQAALGSTWTLFRETSGLEIRATLTVMGAVLLNGLADSFRRVTLQAYQNQLPITHFHNGRTLEWTKLQGWNQTLDWFPFPYFSSQPSRPNIRLYGSPEDTSTYDRLADTLDLSKGRTLADLQGLYKPGTVLRTYSERGNYGNKEFYRYTQDSVLAIQVLGVRVIVQFWRNSCEFQLIPPAGSSPLHWATTPYPGTFYADTFIADPGRIAKQYWILPDVVDPSVGPQSNWSYLLNAPICGRPQVGKDLLFTSLHQGAGSYNILPSSDSRIYVQTGGGLGSTISYSCNGFSEINMPYSYSRVEYLKTDSCTYGDYLDVPALSITQIGQNNSITLYPNPANDFLQLTVPEATGVVKVAIVNLQGTVVASKAVTGPVLTMPVGYLPVGIYFVQFSGKNPVKPCKFIISR